MFGETLTPQARSLLAEIGALEATRGFYLAGGSAVALHLGHRVSVDLDFFTPRRDYEPEPVVQSLAALGTLVVQQQSRGTLVATVGGVQVSFFVFPYPLVEPLVEHGSARIASRVDLALMKIVAISQRGRMRDFVDLHALLTEGLRLTELLDRLPSKYRGISLPAYHLLRALVYFDDAEQDAPPRMLVPWSWQETKRYFESEVASLMDRFRS